MTESHQAGTPAVHSNRDFLKVWGPAAIITLAGFVAAWQYVDPAPPKRLRVASGSSEGAYYQHATRYRELLAEHGITLEVIETAGSVDNLERLQAGDCDLGFVQGGTASIEAIDSLESLASLYFEPLWVFYHEGIQLQQLADLEGRRIAIGEAGSGTQLLGRKLLADNGIGEESAELRPLASKAAAEQLQAGQLDVALFVSSASAPVVRELVTDPRVAVMSFRRHLAYRTRYRFLSSVTLGEGVIDLDRNIPEQDIKLLAPAATLVAVDDLHPDLVPLLLEVAQAVHGEGGLFEEPGQFPSVRFTELPMRTEAQHYLDQGPSLLYRILPFRAASLASRLAILLLPLVTLLIPLFKVGPPLYRWGVRRKIYRWYQGLRELDLKLVSEVSRVNLDQESARLRALEKEVNAVSVPLAYMDEFYHLRLHIELIRNKLDKAQKDGAPSTAPSGAGNGSGDTTGSEAEHV